MLGTAQSAFAHPTRFALPILRRYFASPNAPKIRAQERMPLW